MATYRIRGNGQEVADAGLSLISALRVPKLAKPGTIFEESLSSSMNSVDGKGGLGLSGSSQVKT